MDASKMQLDLEGAPGLGSNVQEVSARQTHGVDDYQLLAGKASHIHDAYNALELEVADRAHPAIHLIVDARAYNGAIAFRYRLPSSADMQDFILKQEGTEFRISKDATTWALELPNHRSMYESEYVRLPVSAFANQGGVASHFLIGLPMLLHVPGVAWMAITEADLEGSAAMYLNNLSESWTGHSFVSELAPNIEQPGLAVMGVLPYESAWRVLLVGDEPGRLIESNVITDLNPPNRVEDTSWIHPGKASWDWWSGDASPGGKFAFDDATMKYYVDFAAQSGFPYMLVDAGWSPIDDITRMNGRVDIPALIQYAAAKKVKIWIWLLAHPTSLQMNEAFALYEKWGVAGVKIDFIERDDEGGIRFYYDVARAAAKHHLMVDFHGATKPWGIERTYPNVMGQEGVLGMEQNKSGMRDNLLDRTTIPFTRMLAGPMDYTPGGFRNVTEDEFVPQNRLPMVMGTRAQQLALYVIYRAPIQMVSDAPFAYAGQPEFQFIRDVPTVWDETRVLEGRPGESVAIARRSGNDWYLGAITNTEGRDLSLKLSFLETGSYTAEIYEDASDAVQKPTHVQMRRMTVHAGENFPIHLASGGGCAVRFVKQGN